MTILQQKSYPNFIQIATTALFFSFMLFTSFQTSFSFSLQSILFRDLKPDNIGFDFDGNVKLFDFGLAKCINQEDVTRRGPDEYCLTGFVGTPRYMSNEVFKGLHYGLPADVYSFSIILYEVVTLKKFFEELKTIGKLKRQVHILKRRPKMVVANECCCYPSVTKEFKNWIQKGWSPNPKARPTIGTMYKNMLVYFRDELADVRKGNTSVSFS